MEQGSCVKADHFEQIVLFELESGGVSRLPKLSGEYVTDKSGGTTAKKASHTLRVSGEETRTSRASSSSVI